MTDGSYTQVYSGSTATDMYSAGVSSGDKVYCASSTHSAIFSSGAFKHKLYEVPDNYDYSKVSFLEKINVKIKLIIRQAAAIGILLPLLLMLLAGCQTKENSATVPSETAAPSETAVPTETAETAPDYTAYEDYTDEALLRQALEDGVFVEWSLSSDSTDYSLAGLYRLSEKSPALYVLLNRTSAVASIKALTPALIEEYAGGEDSGLSLSVYALEDIVQRVLS